jgi:hypothetical protein
MHREKASANLAIDATTARVLLRAITNHRGIGWDACFGRDERGARAHPLEHGLLQQRWTTARLAEKPGIRATAHAALTPQHDRGRRRPGNY